MNAVFSRVDYAQVGTTSAGCLRILKERDSTQKDVGGKKKDKKPKSSDKIVVGGQNGILLCLERKNGDTSIVYKTPPGPVINCVRLGGALQTVQDKAFVASRAEVRGFSRKGKQFLVFESNMTEGITSMYIYGVDMFLCGRNSFYHFHDCVEKNSYICSDQINDVLCLPITEGGWVGRGITPVLACGDKTIKVIEGSRLAYEVLLNEIANILHLFMNDGGFNRQKILYGTRNGKIGLVDLSPTEGIICFELETKSFSAVTAIDCYRILDDSGCLDVIVGKEDGLIEIYSVDETDSLNFRQLYQCDESITAMECGRVGSDSYNEIVVCTYTGWVFALTTEPFALGDTSLAGKNGTAAQEQQKQTPQLEIKVQQLKSELEDLESKVREERDRYQEMGKSQNPQEAAMFASVPPFTINDKFALKKELACYTLSVELAIPIDYVLLQSDVKVDLMDVERNSAVVSVTQSEPGSGNALLAVYRCQADITRMEMRIRSIEGQFGTLKMYDLFVPQSA